MSVRRFYISKQRRTTLPVKSNVTISFVNSEGENSPLTRRSFYRGLTVTFQSKQIFCYCPFIVWNVPVLATFLNVQISIWRREQIIDAANIVCFLCRKLLAQWDQNWHISFHWSLSGFYFLVPIFILTHVSTPNFNCVKPVHSAAYYF